MKALALFGVSGPVLRLIATCFFLSIISGMGAQEQLLPVVPHPQEVSWEEGNFSPREAEITLQISGFEEPTRGIVIDQLQEAFSAHLDVKLSTGETLDPDIWIGLPGTDAQFNELAALEAIEPEHELGEEGYILKTGKNRIFITANAKAGAFYGVQTLVQLLRGSGASGTEVPQVTIRDWPAIQFRCLMDDVSRGPITRMEYMKQQVRRSAEMKYNHLSYYLEGIVETKSHPGFAPEKGGISIEEFRDLAEYAKGYHISLVGNFQSLGHLGNIVQNPQYKHLGATHRMLDPLNPEGMEMLRDVYRELAQVLPSDLFHVNLDEAWDLSRGKLGGTIDSVGVERIYADHLKRIDTTLRELGKRTMIWGDIILDFPGILNQIPKDILLAAWNYDPSDSFARFIDPLKEAGFEFTVSPGVVNADRIMPDYGVTMTNIRNFINEGYQKGTYGVYCTVWDYGGIHFFAHTWYGVAYTAEQSWRPNREPLEGFDRRYSLGLHGDPDQRVPRTLWELNELAGLWPTYEMNTNAFLKALVPEQGDDLTFNQVAWEEVKKHVEKAREITLDASLPYYDNDLSTIRFTIDQYGFMAKARSTLLLAARAYDRALELQGQDRQKAMDELQSTKAMLAGLTLDLEQLIADFNMVWDLESRPHWKDNSRDLIVHHLVGFQEQSRLLEQAIKGFESGVELPASTEVRVDIREQPGQYFHYWLLSGSFPLETMDESATDFLQSMGGESAARPYPGEIFTAPDGTRHMWLKTESHKQRDMDFSSIYDSPSRAVVYGYCAIDSREDQTVTALLGSSDGASVWCNGEQVYHFHGQRSLTPDQDAIPLELKKGRNHILVKVVQSAGDWELSFRLKDVDVRNHKQKYYIQ
jgi:hexosaminidase